MTKNQRKQELFALFSDVEDNEKQLIDKLLDEVVFLEERMAELKRLPFLHIHPKNPSMQRVTPAARLYKECSQSYMNAVRILLSTLRKVESTAQDELLKRLEEFS